jgi:NitT/TauT family transport system ATP-binding protein
LRDIDLAVDAGHFITLIGPSGCGKSTLLRLLAGLDEPDQGAVTLFGGSPDAARRAKGIGLVAQRPALLPWLSVLDNVTLPQRVNRRRRAAPGPDAAGILAAVGLGDVLHRKPHELSGGMQQRVAIARAFALAPRLLLMDEPFAALDEFTREALQVQLLALWQRWRTTVVFVTHSIREAMLLGDTVVVMAARPGRVLATRVIDLPRPRGAELIGSASLGAYEDELRRSWTHRA